MPDIAEEDEHGIEAYLERQMNYIGHKDTGNVSKNLVTYLTSNYCSPKKESSNNAEIKITGASDREIVHMTSNNNDAKSSDHNDVFLNSNNQSGNKSSCDNNKIESNTQKFSVENEMANLEVLSKKFEKSYKKIQNMNNSASVND